MNAPISISIVTEPTAEPITLAEAKEHCKIDHGFEDYSMTGWIKAARAHVEGLVGPIMPQTVDAFWAEWPCGDLDLPWGKMRAVTEFGHTPSTGVETAWTISGANLLLNSVVLAHVNLDRITPGRITLAYGKSWPADTLRTYNAVRVRLSAGWASSSAVPQDIKQAMLLLIDDWRINRADSSDRTISRSISNGVNSLLRKHRRVI